MNTTYTRNAVRKAAENERTAQSIAKLCGWKTTDEMRQAIRRHAIWNDELWAKWINPTISQNT